MLSCFSKIIGTRGSNSVKFSRDLDGVASPAPPSMLLVAGFRRFTLAAQTWRQRPPSQVGIPPRHTRRINLTFSVLHAPYIQLSCCECFSSRVYNPHVVSPVDLDEGVMPSNMSSSPPQPTSLDKVKDYTPPNSPNINSPLQIPQWVICRQLGVWMVGGGVTEYVEGSLGAQERGHRVRRNWDSGNWGYGRAGIDCNKAVQHVFTNVRIIIVNQFLIL